MNKLFFLLLGFHQTWAADPNNECQSNNEGYWICLKNQDDTFNVTYDCSLNTNKTLELQLWSSKFPKAMKILNIQNCERLILNSNCTSLDEPIKTFKYLHILNISEFSLIGRINETRIEFNSGTYDRMHDHIFTRIYYRPKGDSQREYSAVRLPENVVFENIKMARFDFPLMSRSSSLLKCGPNPDKFKLESFKLINVTMDQLDTYFFWEYPEDSRYMKEFVMEKVTVGNVQKRAIYLHNSEAKVEINNSNFSKISGTFADLDVSKVLISQNSFGELPTFAFKVFADKFIFSRNEVATLKRFSLRIESLETEITNNIFHYLEDHALRGLIPPKYPPNLYSSLPQRILNISDNIIHVLASSSLSINSDETEESEFFDVLIVMNNLVTCSCQNIYWFNGVRFDTHYTFKKLFHYYWFNKDNQNRCLNIPNCGLNQAYNNYHELCEENYKCPNTSKSLKRILDGEIVPLVNETNETSQNVSRLLENVKYLLEKKNHAHVQKPDSEHEYFYMRIIFYCVLIVTILCLLGLVYVMVKCFQCRDRIFRIICPSD